ncbi:MAG: hypothetical protein QXY61_02040 [Candidatus Anstonellales archaeon]
MKTRLMMLLMGGLSVFLPFEINKPPRPPIAKVWAYDPLTANILSFYEGKKLLKKAGPNLEYDSLYALLKNEGYSIPYSPPKEKIKTEQIVVKIPIDSCDIKAIVLEKSERAYILYQLLTGRTKVDVLGIDELRHPFGKKVLFTGYYSDIDTIDLDYVLTQSDMACLEFAVLCGSVLLSYGYSPEIKILLSKNGGHAFIQINGIIIDDEYTRKEDIMLKYYGKEWGKEYRIINLFPQ